MDYLSYEDNFKKIANTKSTLKKGAIGKRHPMVSIAITTYKRADLLKQALDSALNQQNFSDYEVIVVDNEPEEETDTEKLIQMYTIEKLLYYKNEKNLGMVGNWNRAIELSRGEWITILHDDDALHPLFLSSVFVKAKTRNIDLIACGVKQGQEPVDFLSTEASKKNKFYKINISRCLLGSISPFPGVLFKKEISLRLGGFNDKFYPISDYIFWSNYCRNYDSYYFKKILAFYRVNYSNTTGVVFENIVKKSFDFKTFLSNYCCLPGLLKNILIHTSMANLINGYEVYGSLNHFKEKSRYSIIYKNRFLLKIITILAVRVTKCF